MVNLEQLEKSRKATIIVLAFMAIGGIVIFFSFRSWIDPWIGNSPSLSSDRIGMASVLIMQIDSFLAAAFVIGFFQFQRIVSKMIQQIASLKIAEEIGRPEERKTLGLWKNMKGRLSYFGGYRFPMEMLGLVFLVLSALYAVRTTLLETRDDLVTSITFLVEGLTFMMIFWYVATSQTESMAEKIGESVNREGADSGEKGEDIGR